MHDDDEPIVEAAGIIARAIHRLGNAEASTPMGGLEALGAVHEEAAKERTEALREIDEKLGRLADAAQNISEALGAIDEGHRKSTERVAEAICYLADTIAFSGHLQLPADGTEPLGVFPGSPPRKD